MEYILMSLFGGGSADWQMIGKTEYDWDTIFTNLKMEWGSLDEVSFNDLIVEIFQMAKQEFVNAINNVIKLNEGVDNENIIEDMNKLKSFDFDDDENWDIWANYLDNHITLMINDDDLVEIVKSYLEEDIEEIENNIGFTYINIE